MLSAPIKWSGKTLMYKHTNIGNLRSIRSKSTPIDAFLNFNMCVSTDAVWEILSTYILCTGHGVRHR